jgi:hypothetical protein
MVEDHLDPVERIIGDPNEHAPEPPRASARSRASACGPHDAQRRASTAKAFLPAPQPPS